MTTEMRPVSLTHVATPVGGQPNPATRSTPLGATPPPLRVYSSEPKVSHATRVVIATPVDALKKANLVTPDFEDKMAAKGSPAEPLQAAGARLVLDSSGCKAAASACRL